MIINKAKRRKLKIQRRERKKEKVVEEIIKGNIPKFIPQDHPLFPNDKPLRLSKIARELNKGVGEIVKFFSDNGIAIDSDPNFKLNSEQIDILNGSRKIFQESFIVDYTWRLLEELKLDYNIIFRITPEQFEKIVAEFLTRSGFTVRLNGDTNRKDGGIDIIAWKKDIVTLILAVQVKLKRDVRKKVTASEVRDFKGAISINDYFTAGMVVTNTDFTADARWIEERLNSKIELKNYQDLKEWLNNNFLTNKVTHIDISITKDVKYCDKYH